MRPQQVVVPSTEPRLDHNSTMDFLLQLGQPANDTSLSLPSEGVAVGKEADFNADVFG
jgi:hypothetical protein